jgi:FkbM family methyltransferase
MGQLADRNSHVLAISTKGSDLLLALDRVPGVHTHLHPNSVLEGALDIWPTNVPKFNVCLIEVSSLNYGTTTEIFDAVTARLGDQGKLLFLWNDRLDVTLRFAVSEIVNAITARKLKFQLYYTLSWASVLASRITSFAKNPTGWYGLKYPLALFSLAAGGLIAVLAKFQYPTRTGSNYVSENCSSITVDIDTSIDLSRTDLMQGGAIARKALLSRQSSDIDLYFNTAPEFTKWMVKSGTLHAPFVVIDVGVLGGENPRWHFLREKLIVHGFDAIEEVIEELQRTTADSKWDSNYHALAIGNEDGERKFFVDPKQLTNSSFSEGAAGALKPRLVQMRTLDSLLKQGVIPRADFLKVDVEGFEREVFLGAQGLLSGGVLGVEVETNFNTSPEYPKGHFGLINDLVLQHGLHLFDLNFDRAVRPSYESIRRRSNRPITPKGAGVPSTFNVLFCRDLTAERDGHSYYERKPAPATVDQILKMMTVYELHGLNDVAIETAITFSNQLSHRIDVEQAIELLTK